MIARFLPSPVAALAFAGFVAGAVGVGDVYPFARLAMYAASPLREEGAVLEARVDGQRVELSAFVAFDGIDPAALDRPDLPVSTGYVVRAAQRQLRAAPAGGRDRADAVRIELGYRRIGVAGDLEPPAGGAGVPAGGAAGSAPPMTEPTPEALRVEPPPPALPDDPNVPPPGPPRAPGDLGRAGLRRAEIAEWIPVAEGWAWPR